MRITITTAALIALSISTSYTHGFTSPSFQSRTTNRVATHLSSTPGPNDEQSKRMAEILKEEALNPETMKQTAEKMNNMSQADLDEMLKEVGSMSPAQEASMKALGMNPELMKTTMNMMKDNPDMMKTAQKMMSQMTPEQLMEQSQMAQQQMASMSNDEIMGAAASSAAAFGASGAAKNIAVDVEVDGVKVEDAEVEPAAPTPKNGPLGSSQDPAVVETMFATAQYLSTAPAGGITLAAFRSLPPIAVLSGEREFDLSKRELEECWEYGSNGASIVDRAGFERVWDEVCELFEDDVMDEARKTIAATKKKVRSESGPALVADPTVPAIGETLTPEQLQFTADQVKSMTDDDTKEMLNQMANISPEEAARMKSMGVDTEMMKKSAEMMRDNPLMRKAAQAMMKNMNPEQMMKMSQQAQEQMKSMSKEDLEDAMKRVEQSGKE